MTTGRIPRCDTCGDRIGFNPKAQAAWDKYGKGGTVPGAGWHHREADFGGNSRMKSDPDFHYAVPPEGITPGSETIRRQAADEQGMAMMKRNLSRQFDHLDAEKRGGTHIDLAED